MNPDNLRRAQRGVTLVELMIVLVILAIITAIAVPSYRNQVLRSNRSNAKSQLMQTAQTLERCFTRLSTYTGCVASPRPMAPGDVYQVTIAVPNALEYVLTATPQGGQAEDTACGNFTLNQASVRGESGTGTVEECWAR